MRRSHRRVGSKRQDRCVCSAETRSEGRWKVKVTLLGHPTLCDPVDWSLAGSSVHGVLQARILGWVAISSSRRSSRLRDRTQVSRIAGRRFTGWATRAASKWGEVRGKWKSLSCVRLFATPWTVRGILQARILVWVAFPFSRGSSQPRDWTQVSCIAGRFSTSWATRGAQEHWRG